MIKSIVVVTHVKQAGQSIIGMEVLLEMIWKSLILMIIGYGGSILLGVGFIKLWSWIWNINHFWAGVVAIPFIIIWAILSLIWILIMVMGGSP
jgi:hypothetical protein